MSALQRMLDTQKKDGGDTTASAEDGAGRRGRWNNRAGNHGGDTGTGGLVRQGGWRDSSNGWQDVSNPKKHRHSSNGHNQQHQGRRSGSDSRGRGRGGSKGGSGNGNGNGSGGFSHKDRKYTELRADITRQARQKQSSFLAEAAKAGGGGGGAELALTAAFKEELVALKSWVGDLSEEGQCTYYQDRLRKYPFFCGSEGHVLLNRLLEHNAKLLKINIALCLQQGDPRFVMAEGELIYEIKPTLKAYGSTWSQEEYGHPGLQRTYIKLKSFQRFTETWATLERSAAAGLFDMYRPDYQTNGSEEDDIREHPIRIASIGGGPGYELLATRLFFDRFAPNVKLELVSLDLCPSWRQYVEGLGFTFYHWDIRDGKLLETMQMTPGDLTFVIISYVLIYCSDDATMDMLATLLNDGGVRAIIVSERSESTAGCGMMEARGVHVEKLMDQSLGRDERQCVYVNDSNMLRSNEEGADVIESVFPNVPFSEHKQARHDGGHRLGWRPWHEDK